LTHLLEQLRRRPAHASRFGYNRHNVRAGHGSVARDLRLRADKSCDNELRAVSCETTCAERHPCKWRCSGTDLDAIAGERGRDGGEAQTVRRPNSEWTAGAAGRTRFNLRAACGE